MLGKKIANTISSAIKDQSRKELFKRLKGSGGIISVIVGLIKKGISPVKGVAGRFQKYSEAYRNRFGRGELSGKKKSPVNMTVSGEMLDSFHLSFENNRIYLKSHGRRNNELIVIHNTKGAGKSKVIRRMLPTNKGEEFTPRVSTVLNKNLKDSVNFSILRFLPKKVLKIKINTSK